MLGLNSSDLGLVSFSTSGLVTEVCVLAEVLSCRHYKHSTFEFLPT